MQNDQNPYGTSPASKKSIEKLKKEKVQGHNLETFKEQECSVCKENYKLNDNLTVMPCNHNFHEECLVNWLKLHNSCPICRMELTTDDNDYEQRKNEVRQT